jgi:transposase
MTQSPSSKPVELTTDDQRTREQLLKENDYLRAELAYLKKLDALIQAEKRKALLKKPK